MPEQKKQNIFTRFNKMSIDSIPKTVLVAIVLCLFCSMVVSFAAVNLKSFQLVNKTRDKQINILQVAGIYYKGIDVEESFASIEPMIVDINQGVFTDKFDPYNFDNKKVAADPNLSVTLKDDPASIGTRPNYATIYLLKNKDESKTKIY